VSAPDELDPAMRAALELVADGQTLGLGTGRAATAFVRGLGARVRDGLKVRGVATSEATAALARDLEIPLLTLAEAGTVDITFDGADEVDPNLDVIKGYGGALVREKIVAASSDQLIILVGSEKLVSKLGERGKLPVEVVPFAQTLAESALAKLGCDTLLRHDADGNAYLTDNGNPILDCKLGPIDDPVNREREILGIPGVVGTGLFLGMADAVVVQDGSQVEVRKR